MTTTFADKLVFEGFRGTEFTLDQVCGRTCQLHSQKWEACFRPISGPYQSMSECWVPAYQAITPRAEFCFSERLRYLQWEKRTGVIGSLFEATLALAYSTTSRHQTGVMIQTWLNPAPTLKALNELDFDVPFTVLYLDGMRSEVTVAWYGTTWTLELSAFTFCDLIRCVETATDGYHVESSSSG